MQQEDFKTVVNASSVSHELRQLHTLTGGTTTRIRKSKTAKDLMRVKKKKEKKRRIKIKH